MGVNSLPYILLIDDDEEERIILQEALIALNIKIGLRRMANSSGFTPDQELPALILLDINIPGKSGFEILQELKSKELINQVPVIMYSTSERLDDIRLSYELGAQSYAVKPKCFDERLALVKHLESTYGLGKEFLISA
jgi:DNA-binding response OmpR family regulator